MSRWRAAYPPHSLYSMLAAAGLLVIGAPAGAQLKVERISRNLQHIQGSTRVIEWRPVGEFNPRPIQEGDTIEVDDDLRSPSPELAVLLRCGASAFRFLGQFRLIVLPPEGRRCIIHLLSGTAEVLSDSTSGVKSGEIVAGALGTQYRVSVTRRRPLGAEPGTTGIIRAITVYEGRVSVSARGDVLAVSGGSELRAGERGLERVEISPETIARSADVYTRLDLSSTVLPTGQRDSAARVLSSRYVATLRSGADPDARLELAVSQFRYGVVSRDVLYNLDKASRADTAAGERAATVTWLRGVALNSLGDSAAAIRYLREARRLDPDVEQRIIQRYRIDPVRIRAAGAARPESRP